MELITVIHHPGKTIRPADELASELAAEYDRAMDAASKRFTASTNHTTLILLEWPPELLDYPNWYAATDTSDEQSILATAGLPLIKSPPDSDESDAITPDMLHRAIGRPGEAMDRSLGFFGGYFAAARLDRTPTGGSVRLVTNYLAEVPLYRAERDGVTVWSNKVTAAARLAGLDTQIDQQGVEEFCLLSHCLDDRTLWVGVETEPPAMAIDLTADGIQRKPYLNLPHDYFAFEQPSQQIAERFVKQSGALVRLLEKHQANNPPVIHLSGGQDSRAVAATIRHHGFKPRCLTQHDPCDEIPSARRLARFLGLPYGTVSGQVSEWDTFTANSDGAVWQSDGLMSLKYVAGRYDATYTRDQGRLPIEGLGGEYGRAYFYGDPKGFEKLEHNNFEKIVGKSVGNREVWWPNTDAVDSTRDRISAILAEAKDNRLSGFQTSTWFYVNQKMRRWATARRNIGWVWTIDPLQMPCWTFRGMSADPKDQIDEKIIKQVMNHAQPGTSDVPTVDQLKYQARRRRVASNRIVRIAMRVYDKYKKPFPEHVWPRAIREHRSKFIDLIADANVDALPSPDQVNAWLDVEPWQYLQQELFWHAVTVARWATCVLRSSSGHIKPALAAQGAIGDSARMAR